MPSFTTFDQAKSDYALLIYNSMKDFEESEDCFIDDQ